MKKVLFVATVVKTHIMEFHVPYLKRFKEMGWETSVASRNDYENPADCVIPYCDHYYDISFGRNPLNPGNIPAYGQLKKVIDDGGYDIIHCHTPAGAMLTRLAARRARKQGSLVVYTAHGFHFYRGAPVINWLLYYPAEKWLSGYTDVLITINKEDYGSARAFKAPLVKYVPGVGVDMDRFAVSSAARKQKRQELALDDGQFVLLAVGELIHRKNHALVLEALAGMKGRPGSGELVLLICGHGRLAKKLRKKAVDLGIESSVRFLGYRGDIPEICNAADVFIFMSRQEGLPVALMEAMACGLPVICSGIRGNTDLISDGADGRVVGMSARELGQAVLSLMDNPEMRGELARAGMEKVKQFGLDTVLGEVFRIYGEGLELKGRLLGDRK